jgi:hypothetical protein
MKTSLLRRARRFALAFVASLLVVMSSAVIAGAPLKGIDVKLGKNPGGTVASRMTDASGGFSFGVVPKGSYRITMVLPAGAELAKAKAIEIRVYSTGKGPVTAVLAASGVARKSGAVIAADFIVVVSDGVHPIRGYASSTDSLAVSPVATRSLHGIVSLIK